MAEAAAPMEIDCDAPPARPSKGKAPIASDGKSAPWVEKYRPRSLSDVAAHRDIVDTNISDIKTRKGLALVDIVREVTMFVFKIQMPSDVQVKLINDLADIECEFSSGLNPVRGLA
ncbi:hypothetical protein COCNU_03G003510 [Cocos nucifera]|uniref:Replication factor C C-terminal domain-containing protein n=1 Tax=Cocos nucifera TaxID=13894 RepID=A0A8K0I1Q3_COCNU|nr:hypothetical protein COCNU_03G003510 [Cocos nucifera]